MTVPAALTGTFQWWSAYYGDHRLVSVLIRFLHIAGLVVGGGTALATDRLVLRGARGGAEDRRLATDLLAGSHRLVVPALAVVVATGVLLTAADLDTFLHSRLYWIKMASVGLLLANGAGLVAAESAVHRQGDGASWRWMGVTSGASLALWLLILLFGTWLTVAA